ncbi:MAG: hypothetical protein GY832_26220 [Chloroflexi bacterium]|nr:hypothetical protein [Chloroflexota bacterium]
MENFQTNLEWLWSLAGVQFIVSHTLINVVVAISASVQDKNDTFQYTKLFDFLGRKLLPYVLVYGAVKAVGVDAGLDMLALPLWALIEAALLADLAENLARMGVPIPERALSLLGKGGE